jgi:hypothetical protein
MLVPVREYASARDMRATYHSIRDGFLDAQPLPEPVPPPLPEPPPELPPSLSPKPSRAKPQETPMPTTAEPEAHPNGFGKFTVDEVKRAVCWAWGIRGSELFSSSRLARLVVPRQIAYALARRLTSSGLLAISHRVGGRDHTTVLYGARKMMPLIDAVALRIDCDAAPAAWAKAVRQEVDERRLDGRMRTPYARRVK